ncbi:MAG TPA: hypothetical protein DEQ28_01890 [Clostridiales bacterium]|nr:hypothetical protein [Clostridiales bacterium]
MYSRQLEDRTVSDVSRIGRAVSSLVIGKLTAALGLALKKLLVLAGKKLLLLAAKAALATLKAFVLVFGKVALVVALVLALASAVSACLPVGAPGPDPGPGGTDADIFLFRELYEAAVYQTFPPEGLEFRADHELPWAVVWAVHLVISPELDERWIPQIASMLAPRFEWVERTALRGRLPGRAEGLVIFERQRLIAAVDRWSGRVEYRHERRRVDLPDGSWREYYVATGPHGAATLDRLSESLSGLLGRPVAPELVSLLAGAAMQVQQGNYEVGVVDTFLLRVDDF